MAKAALPLISLTDGERAALEVVWLDREASRIRLADRLGVSRMQASNIVRGLVDKGLITDLPQRDGGRGQPVRLLGMADDAVSAIGVKIWRTRLEFGTLNCAGQIERPQQVRLEAFTVTAVAEAANTYIRETQKRGRCGPLVGVGFAFPGYFTGSKSMTQAYFPEWNDLDVGAALQPYFEQPVLVENDGACAAWGERLLGAAKTLDDFLFLDINYGVGGGVVIGGKLVRGAHGNAGVFGVPFPVGTVRPSGQDLMDTMRAAGLMVDDLPDLGLFPVADHPVIGRWIERAAEQLRPALGVLAGAFDPQAVIVGGAAPPEIIQALVRALDNGEFCAATHRFIPVPTLAASEVGPSVGVAGAAALALGRALFPRRTV